jgi:succinyl-CoA synthetase alpha subunit
MQHASIEKSAYLDSVSLMRISRKIREIEGVRDAIVAMATDSNLLLIQEAGFDLSKLSEATAHDLIVAVDVEDETALEAARSRIREELAGGTTREGSMAVPSPRSLEDTLVDHPEVNLVLVSVPGPFAAHEARKALAAGRHVMIFSDNVAVEDEKALKIMARDRGLLCMGPDCGTAIINGVGLGFANQVPRGSIGIVSASGTGAQEVSSIAARQGFGMSQVIGTGGRDLSPLVGGITTIAALRVLARDPETEVVVLISKVPDREVAELVLTEARKGGKPCVVHFAGDAREGKEGNLVFARTLAGAASEATGAAAGDSRLRSTESPDVESRLKNLQATLASSRRFLRGLFSGGTLAQEAVSLIGPDLGTIRTNMNITGSPRLDDPAVSIGHSVVDLGDDTFTRGRAHPMIDQTYRLVRLAREVRDPETAVILLDVVLGYGCNEDPGGEIARHLKELRRDGPAIEGGPIAIASICGTYDDPQGYDRQRDALEEAGVVVARTNAGACALALTVLKGR